MKFLELVVAQLDLRIHPAVRLTEVLDEGSPVIAEHSHVREAQLSPQVDWVLVERCSRQDQLSAGVPEHSCVARCQAVARLEALRLIEHDQIPVDVRNRSHLTTRESFIMYEPHLRSRLVRLELGERTGEENVGKPILELLLPRRIDVSLWNDDETLELWVRVDQLFDAGERYEGFSEALLVEQTGATS